jgi:undecaprenyl-diphosphatase
LTFLPRSRCDFPTTPRISFGHLKEPLNLIFVGSQTQLEDAFSASGWVKASPFGLLSVAQGIGAALAQRPLPDGPGVPAFWNDEPDTMAFSLPVGTTFARRHHIRLWRTGYVTTDGHALWVATASFDRDFELASSNLPFSGSRPRP